MALKTTKLMCEKHTPCRRILRALFLILLALFAKMNDKNKWGFSICVMVHGGDFLYRQRLCTKCIISWHVRSYGSLRIIKITSSGA